MKPQIGPAQVTHAPQNPYSINTKEFEYKSKVLKNKAAMTAICKSTWLDLKQDIILET